MNTKNNVREAFKQIPSVDEILSNIKYDKDIPNHLLKTKVRELLENLRKDIKNNKIPKNIPKHIYHKVEGIIKDISSPSLKNVINGTGIILNTGLGRAPLSKKIIDSVSNSIYPYCNLEVNENTNKRSTRLDHIEPLFNNGEQ